MDEPSEVSVDPVGSTELEDPGRTDGLAGLSWAAVANLLTALGNTVSVFAISVAAGSDERFGVYAAALATMVFAFSVSRGLLGETLTLQRDVAISARQYVAASFWLTAALGIGCGAVLTISSDTRSIAALSAAAVFALLFNDALRHWAFRHQAPRAVAISDGLWFLGSLALYVVAVAADVGPGWVFGLWAATGLAVALPLVRVPAAATAASSAMAWLRSTSTLSMKLAAEASAAAAAVTVPLAATAVVMIDGHEAGGIRLLQSFFGFQQIAFFSALVTIGSAANSSRRQAYRAGVVLAVAGSVLSLVVAVMVLVIPTSLLTDLLGESATVARDGVWSFAALQVLIAVSNGALLAMRAGGKATEATVPRVIGALVATVLATLLMGGGVDGFALGSSIGVVVFMVLLIRPLRRL